MMRRGNWEEEEVEVEASLPLALAGCASAGGLRGVEDWRAGWRERGES